MRLWRNQIFNRLVGIAFLGFTAASFAGPSQYGLFLGRMEATSLAYTEKNEVDFAQVRLSSKAEEDDKISGGVKLSYGAGELLDDSLYSFGLFGRYDFFLEQRFTPYFLAGVDAFYAEGSVVGTSPSLGLGLGLDFSLGESTHLNVEYQGWSNMRKIQRDPYRHTKTLFIGVSESF